MTREIKVNFRWIEDPEHGWGVQSLTKFDLAPGEKIEFDLPMTPPFLGGPMEFEAVGKVTQTLPFEPNEKLAECERSLRRSIRWNLIATLLNLDVVIFNVVGGYWDFTHRSPWGFVNAVCALGGLLIVVALWRKRPKDSDLHLLRTVVAHHNEELENFNRRQRGRYEE